ncbi:PorV/PorQ family protein [candidate division KSB1 bacterium]
MKYLMAVVLLTSFHHSPGVAAEPLTTTGLSFLKMGGGVRAAGLGGAYSAVSEDAFSLRWNCAGIAGLDGYSLGLAHNSWYQGIRHEEAVFSDFWGSFAYGLLFANQTVPEIEFREDRPSDDPIDTFSAHDFVLGAFLSRRLGERLALGGGLKWIYEKIYTDQSQGSSWDLGLTYRLLPRFTLSASVLDQGGNIRTNDYDLELPSRLVLGGAYRTGAVIGRSPLLLVVDYTRPKHNPARFNAGLEVPLRGFIDLRGGYLWGDRLAGSYSLGLGIRVLSVRLDYAYQPIRYDLGRIHRIGLIWGG